jgi:hypothetical protein
MSLRRSVSPADGKTIEQKTTGVSEFFSVDLFSASVCALDRGLTTEWLGLTPKSFNPRGVEVPWSTSGAVTPEPSPPTVLELSVAGFVYKYKLTI